MGAMTSNEFMKKSKIETKSTSHVAIALRGSISILVNFKFGQKSDYSKTVIKGYDIKEGL